MKVTYGRMLVTEFTKLQDEYDYSRFINDLEEERLALLKRSSEKEIKEKRLYKEHHLVRYFRKTYLEMKLLESASKPVKEGGKALIDIGSIGNSMAFKNDLNALMVFVSNMEQKGYKKQKKAS